MTAAVVVEVVEVDVRVDTDVDVSQLVLKIPVETLTVQVGIVDVAPNTTRGWERRPVTSSLDPSAEVVLDR